MIRPEVYRTGPGLSFPYRTADWRADGVQITGSSIGCLEFPCRSIPLLILIKLTSRRCDVFAKWRQLVNWLQITVAVWPSFACIAKLAFSNEPVQRRLDGFF